MFLGELRKDITGHIYRSDGEISGTIRRLREQLLLQQNLLTRMAESHGYRPRDPPPFLGSLIAFASSSPVHDHYDVRTESLSVDGESVMVAVSRKCDILPASIRLSWVSPDTWTMVFREHLASLWKPSKKRNSPANPAPDLRDGPLFDTPAGRYLKSMIREILTSDGATVYDPAAGCGDGIAELLRIDRIRNVSSGGVDTVISRLIRASELIHASEPSAVHTAVIRFIIVISIIGGAWRSDSLSGPSLFSPFRALQDQIRTGSILFSSGLAEEFLSETAGYRALRRLHPLESESFLPSGGLSLIISDPECRSVDLSPEVTSYLTQRYRSFQRSVDPAALLVERVYELLSPEGTCIMMIPPSWLSDDAFRGFRRWVAEHLPIQAIVTEDESGDHSGMAALVVQKAGEEQFRVVKLQEETGKPEVVRSFFIHPDKLPDFDGWRLDDPWDEELMQEFEADLMPLSEYLFDEMYEAGDVRDRMDHQQGWISLILTSEGMEVSHGNFPQKDASVVIPGRDLFLSALLSSSLISEYVRIMGKRTAVPDISLIRTIPVRPIDEYSREECRIRDEMVKDLLRIWMLNTLAEKPRPFHDKMRIHRQAKNAQNSLDHHVCRLYCISPKICEKIRSRTRKTREEQNPSV